MRLGTIEAVATPLTKEADQRFSGHLSFVSDVGGQRSDDMSIGAVRFLSQRSSLMPGSARDLARSSYMTTDTSRSRMSGLSEFPAPPEQLTVSPTQAGLLQSYLSATSRSQIRVNDVSETVVGVSLRENIPHYDPHYRTTFGREEDFSRPY